MYTLRPATNADYAWLRTLHHSAMRDVVERTWGWDEILQDNLFQKGFHPEQTQIVQLNGDDVGMIEVEPRANELFLVSIQILPRFQGQELGTSLIRELQRDAEARMMAVILSVITNNQARALYERLGFSITGETETHYWMRWSPILPPEIKKEFQ
jgi:ribosomal protein S18 acetylase RimI-like enzyme